MAETTASTHTVKALLVPRTGGSEVLELTDRYLPALGSGELAIEVAAAGVNFRDVYERQGMYPVPVPFVVGTEGAGTVVALGPDVESVAVGDRVAWASAPGSAATVVIAAADRVVPVPDAVDLDLAAAAMLQGMTAHYLVNSTYPVRAGDTVLVHAAAGGVGQLLVQLAKAKGATVIGTASTEAKRAKATALGADHVIDYTAVDDLAGAVRQLTSGAGVAVVYDGVGKTTFDASLASLRPRGTMVLFGASSGPVPPFDIQRLNSGGSLFLTRPTLAHYASDRDELLWRGGEVLSAIERGALRIEIGGRYSLAEAKQAYDDLEGRRTTGKLLLVP
jgi:NADPH2:quinone reductase